MADEGHNEACAKAGKETPCTCPCHGAKHGEGMTAFRGSQVAVRAREAARGGGQPDPTGDLLRRARSGGTLSRNDRERLMSEGLAGWSTQNGERSFAPTERGERRLANAERAGQAGATRDVQPTQAVGNLNARQARGALNAIGDGEVRYSDGGWHGIPDVSDRPESSFSFLPRQDTPTDEAVRALMSAGLADFTATETGRPDRLVLTNAGRQMLGREPVQTPRGRALDQAGNEREARESLRAASIGEMRGIAEHNGWMDGTRPNWNTAMWREHLLSRSSMVRATRNGSR